MGSFERQGSFFKWVLLRGLDVDSETLAALPPVGTVLRVWNPEVDPSMRVRVVRTPSPPYGLPKAHRLLRCVAPSTHPLSGSLNE